MASEYPQHCSLSLSNLSLLFHLSLTCSSDSSASFFTSVDANASDFDDGFVFDIDPNLLVDCDELIIGDMIGEGSSSIVHKGWYEDRPVAIKTLLPKETKNATPECKANFQREVKLLSKIEHRNVVKFIGASVEPSMMIITELLEGGSLQKNMKSMHPTAFYLEQSLSYALDISQAMEYLHANGIIHRDLKPSNLLLTKDKIQVKIADFGIAREDMCGEMTCEAGTYRYMAPELLSIDPLPKGAKKFYDHKADVFSFAIVMWSLIKNQTPFKERNNLMAAYATVNNMRPSLDEFPEEIVPLLQSCWDKDPKLRPEFSEITEILMRILHNKNAPASTKQIEKADNKNEGKSPKAYTPTSLESSKEKEKIPKNENETLKLNGGVQRKSKPQSESWNGTEIPLPFPNSVKSKPKKKSKIMRFFSCFRSCFAF